MYPSIYFPRCLLHPVCVQALATLYSVCAYEILRSALIAHYRQCRLLSFTSIMYHKLTVQTPPLYLPSALTIQPFTLYLPPIWLFNSFGCLFSQCRIFIYLSSMYPPFWLFSSLRYIYPPRWLFSRLRDSTSELTVQLLQLYIPPALTVQPPPWYLPPSWLFSSFRYLYPPLWLFSHLRNISLRADCSTSSVISTLRADCSVAFVISTSELTVQLIPLYLPPRWLFSYLRCSYSPVRTVLTVRAASYPPRRLQAARPTCCCLTRLCVRCSPRSAAVVFVRVADTHTHTVADSSTITSDLDSTLSR
jgi:hypothetical protein